MRPFLIFLVLLQHSEGWSGLVVPSSRSCNVRLAAFNDGGGGALERASSSLDDAFGKLNLADKYDITLTGLCSKILDSNTTSYGGALEALEDPLLLLQEMTSKNIGPSTRATRSLLDSTASLS